MTQLSRPAEISPASRPSAPTGKAAGSRRRPALRSASCLPLHPNLRSGLPLDAPKGIPFLHRLPSLPKAVRRAIRNVARQPSVGEIAGHRDHRGLRGRGRIAIPPESVFPAAATVSRPCVLAAKFFTQCDHAAFPTKIRTIMVASFYHKCSVCGPPGIGRIGNTRLCPKTVQAERIAHIRCMAPRNGKVFAYETTRACGCAMSSSQLSVGGQCLGRRKE